MKYWINLLTLLLALVLVSCSDDDVPEAENEEELITDVTLVFTSADGETVQAVASDPDGDGPESIEIVSDITLKPNTMYKLTIEVENSIEGENIGEEIQEEADEHQFFFGWTGDVFTNVAGDGNIDGEGTVDYLDTDTNGLPLGLETAWETGEAATAEFQVILKHQPDIKTVNSTVQDGSTDINLTWDLIIE